MAAKLVETNLTRPGRTLIETENGARRWVHNADLPRLGLSLESRKPEPKPAPAPDPEAERRAAIRRESNRNAAAVLRVAAESGVGVDVALELYEQHGLRGALDRIATHADAPAADSRLKFDAAATGFWGQREAAAGEEQAPEAPEAREGGARGAASTDAGSIDADAIYNRRAAAARGPEANAKRAREGAQR